ncbi:MAG TPA: ABC transporter permease [Gaiellaceae bacterium]|nr:ABC transporter permease [Gaiellaceae bacterium]
MPYALRAYAYWFTSYRRIWRGTIASSVLNPVLYLAALGVGLGKLVNHGATPLGVPYLDFVAPGLLAGVAMQVSTIEGAFPVRDAAFWGKQYFAMLSTPLRVGDLVAAQLLWIATRAAMVSAIYLAVIGAFGAVHSAEAVCAIPVGTLIGLAFGAPISALSITAERDPFNPLFRFGITPLFLFSGTFFPISRLPEGLRELAYATPLWHGVDLMRGLTLGTITWARAGAHVAYFCAWIGLGVWLAYRAYRRKLVT